MVFERRRREMKKKTLKLGGNKLPDTGGRQPDWWDRFQTSVIHAHEMETSKNGCIQDGAYRAVNNWPDVDFHYYEKHCELSIRIGGFDISIQRGQNQTDGWVSPFGMVEKDEDFDGVFRITVHRADDFKTHLDDDADDTFYERALLDRVFKAEEGGK
jgi:hypothetical protein